MRYLLLLLTLCSANAHAQSCEPVVAPESNTYAPRRETLRMARSFFPDEGGWEFGHTLIGSFFPLQIAGRYDRLTVTGLTLRGHRGDQVTILGHLRPEARVTDGEYVEPLLEHVLVLNADVAVDFKFETIHGHGRWVADFE